MALWPAIEVSSEADWELVVAAVDDLMPTAVDTGPTPVRVFFATRPLRDQALVRLAADGFMARAVDVDDENWARRSQDQLPPITVGRLTVRSAGVRLNPISADDRPSEVGIAITIRPSMGFGTGHHATTRLCLAALQTLALAGRTLLDVGTGSGILAIAAKRLGAAGAIGIDTDADAVQAATENLALNPEASPVRFVTADVATAALDPVDVVVANLTGATLLRLAARLESLVRPSGTLIVSGLLVHEREAVVEGFGRDLGLEWAAHEEEWAALAFVKAKKYL